MNNRFQRFRIYKAKKIKLYQQSKKKLSQFNKKLLKDSNLQWRLGDWESLAQLSLKNIKDHPARAKLALLSAAGKFQKGKFIDAKRYINLAKKWGIAQKNVVQLLIAGVHNTLGRIHIINNKPVDAIRHFENSVMIELSSTSIKLIAQARLYIQKIEIENSYITKLNMDNINARLISINASIQNFEEQKKYLEYQKASTYYLFDDYDANKYWLDRHSKYRFNMQGVGNKGLSEEENIRAYARAGEIFVSLCHSMNLDLEKIKVLDIGCGNGYYTQVLDKNNVADYLGVDISDVLFDCLMKKYHNYRFEKIDITKDKINEKFDLIIMIDVTQHIVNNKKFSYAMQNIKKSLSIDGVFIVTSWLGKDIRNSFYEVSREIKEYQREFKGWFFSEAIPFRDKYIFSICRRSITKKCH